VNDVQPLRVNEPHPLANLLADTPILSQANFLGQGIDVYGRLDTSGFITPIVDFLKVGTTVVTFLEKDYFVPNCVVAGQDTEVYYHEGTYMSREGVQNSFATHVGVDVSCGAFSGEMSASYSTEFSENTEFAYSYRNYYSKIAVLSLGDVASCLRQSFLHRLNELPPTVSTDNLDPFSDFFRDFGIYYTKHIVLGGRLKFYVAVSNRAQDVQGGHLDVHASVLRRAVFFGQRRSIGKGFDRVG
jgi:hypothetical protein